MMTFIPSFDFQSCATVLDDARLRKQQTEGIQILKTILGISGGWKNHPIVKMWEGSDYFLRNYIFYISKECIKRGFTGRYNHYQIEPLCKIPSWYGDDRLYASHRSRLLFKGRIDSVCYSIKKFLGCRSINSWLINHEFPEKHDLRFKDIDILENICQTNSIDIMPNHYRQFNWAEKECDFGYYWPNKI